MIYTTEKLVSSVKRRTLAPTSQKTFQDPDIIAFLNEELELKLVPLILSVREDYFLQSHHSPITGGIATYPVPERAIGNALKDVWYVDSNGSKSDLVRLSDSDQVEFDGSIGSLWGYVLEGDAVRLLPSPAASDGALDLRHFQRPNELIATTACASIVSSATLDGLTTFTVDTDLTGSLVVGDNVDFLNSKSPVSLWARDVVITAITISSIEVATDSVVDAVDVVMPDFGDFICPAKMANIPMVPQEFHPLLAERCAARVMQALNHRDKLADIQGSIKEMEAYAIKMISNRVEADARAIINRRGIFSNITGGGTSRGRARSR